MSDKPSDNVQRWATIYEAVTGATSAASHHHEEAPGTNPDSLKAGHEPDRFDAKGIIMVPFLVIGTAFVAYVIVTLLFGHYEYGAPDKSNVQSQAAADAAAKPFNERVATIDSSDPHAKVSEPRLEFVRKIDSSRNGKPDDPVYVRSFQSADGNTPIVTPRDLYPDRYRDPLSGKPVLADYEYTTKEKTTARIPIADAMKLVKLPVKKDAPSANSSTGSNPKLSNGGHAIGDGPAKK
ncbi:MAG: hypothetical protein JNK93_15570 [Planctomycetia bacterium]|nr:hypothetical protein [Planctomycetia bacterium]